MIHEPGFTGANANFKVSEQMRDEFGAGTGAEFQQKKPCHYDGVSGRIVCPIK